MLFDYRCRQFGAKAIHEGTTGSFEKFRITWQRLPLISRSLSLSLSLTPNYILYQKPIVCCCWLNQRPPIVTMPASCSSTIKMSVFNLCCTLYSTHSLTLSFNSLSLSPTLFGCAQNFDELLMFCVRKRTAQQSTGISSAVGRMSVEWAIQCR